MSVNYSEKLYQSICLCQENCNEMISYVKRRRDFAYRKLQLDMLCECSRICEFTAEYISEYRMYCKDYILICVKVCETCSKECARFTDIHSQNCSRVCIHCAKECYEYLN